MLFLESFTHRARLAEIVSRWVTNKLENGDVEKIKSIVNFNSYISRIWVNELASALCVHLHGERPQSLVAKNKGALKDFVVENPRYTNPRIDVLSQKYRASPEDFFREAPFDGRVYYLDRARPFFVGATRIKRFRRIAEKGSRRIVEYLYTQIRAQADVLAEDRARRMGIDKNQLITSQREMIEEFLLAENRLLDLIRAGHVKWEYPLLSIPDVIGIKLITEGDQFSKLLNFLSETPGVRLVEQERHSGKYNAINLKVEYKIPKDRLYRRVPVGRHLEIFASRGFDPRQVEAKYLKFLEESEEFVNLEIIVASFEEFMESELGRSMHEERIIQQRSNREYRSPLATNVLYLMDFTLALCLGPYTDDIKEVPIKLWGKYMPDTLDLYLRRLFGIPVDASFDDAA